MPRLLLLIALASAAGWPADQPKSRYVETGELKSPHATQAAAAEGKHVYAISSTKVAKYDRATGKLLAVSTGEARHLNSGFFYKGKLYCAHSNYPKKPDESDVRVLDPATMKLTVHHTFKDPPGSLTWVVRVGEHWWCTFAHYQADNAKTILVKMDERWRELARWKFPKKVIDDWGKMSSSGGIWLDGAWLTTGHSKKALYRLRVPKKGDTLELVETMGSPIPGQGIAHDPKTGGLVGIDRAGRRVVFAEKK
jgi:hypothetical protein